jgi:hypothetical protein
MLKCPLRLLAPAAFMLTALTAAAQPSVTARVNPTNVFAGEPFTYEIITRGGNDVARPDLPDLPNFRGRFSGQQQNISIVNGRRAYTRSFRYTCVVTQPGPFTLPGISIVIDGQVLSTPRVTLTITAPPDPSDRLFVELRVPRDKAFVGQQIEVTLAVGVRPPLLGNRPLPADDVFRLLYGARTSLGPFPKPDRYANERRRISTGELVDFYVFLARTQIVCAEPGPLRFDDVIIGLTYPTRFRQDFFGQYEVAAGDPLSVVAPEADVTVLPVPTQGRPAAFNGAVGTFNLSATATPTRVRVGDPIEVQLTLRGDGPLEQLLPPELDADATLSDSFRISDEPISARVTDNAKVFSTVLRARAADVDEIPPFTFHYFDPDLEQFTVARSNAVPITVDAVETLAANEVVGLSGDDAPGNGSTRLDGLRGNITSEDLLLTTTGTITIGTVALTQVAPAAGFVAVVLLGTLLRRDDDTARQRRRRAATLARQRLATAAGLPPREQAAEILAALRGFLADRLAAPPERFVGRGGVDALFSAGADDDTLQRWAALVDRCEAATYAGGDTAAGEALIADARTCIDAAERVL